MSGTGTQDHRGTENYYQETGKGERVKMAVKGLSTRPVDEAHATGGENRLYAPFTADIWLRTGHATETERPPPRVLKDSTG